MKFYALKSVDLATKQISFQTKNISIIEGIVGKTNPEGTNKTNLHYNSIY